MTNKFWIPITFSNQETEEKIEAAINACLTVHHWTLAVLNDYFVSHAEPYLYRHFRIQLNEYLNLQKDWLPAQRYSLIRAAEKTFPYFSENKKFKGKKFIRVKPINSLDYNEIQIETRQVWKKYLALNGLITTAYGTIFLSDEWADILEEQVAGKSIDFELIPYLWHSVTIYRDIKGESKLRFNLHEIHTKFGRRAEKEVKEKHAQ